MKVKFLKKDEMTERDQKMADLSSLLDKNKELQKVIDNQISKEAELKKAYKTNKILIGLNVVALIVCLTLGISLYNEKVNNNQTPQGVSYENK